MKNLEIIKEGYRNFADGNVEAVLEKFDPEIVWEESAGFPYVENDGTFRGKEEILNKVLKNLPVYMDDFTIQIDDLFEADGKVVMAGHYGGIWKESGKRFLANATHVWTLKNEKVTHFFQAADTAAIMGS